MISASIRPPNAITDFLYRELAGGALGVEELEIKARATGLLGERQQIQHAKVFKKAKKALGIRSIRAGFGSGGKWAWLMPPKHGQKEIVAINNSNLNVKEQHSVREAKTADGQPVGSESRCTVQQWIDGVQSLDYVRCPAALPLIRWHLFLGDCHGFLSSPENWAERAAALGWNALTLFGCRRSRPLEHLGSAGLLWVMNGGNLVELHRDWAVIEREGGSRHIYDRRPLDTPNLTLPWIGLSRPAADQR